MAWAATLHSEYGVVSRFVHMGKDMAEISTSCSIWLNVKHQLCWWHQCKAIKKQLKGNLPTSAYNAKCANEEYVFVNITFKPFSHVDPTASEEGVPGGPVSVITSVCTIGGLLLDQAVRWLLFTPFP